MPTFTEERKVIKPRLINEDAVLKKLLSEGRIIMDKRGVNVLDDIGFKEVARLIEESVFRTELSIRRLIVDQNC